MGIVNVISGLSSELETYNFNGSLRILDLNWKYTEIYHGSEKLDPDYIVKEDDLIIIQVYPEGTGTGNYELDIFLGVITGGIYTGIIAYNKAEESKKDMQKALDKLKNQKDQPEQETIPWLSGGKNEKALGKQVPIILGKHLFTPYFLSDPYLRPAGWDGEDLFFHGAFICGQSGLVIEQIRNGSTKLITFNDTEPQTIIDGEFDRPKLYDPDSPPPFYDPENRVEIVHDGYFNNSIFNQKWVDSLDSTVELGRKKKDQQVIIDEKFIDDLPEPIIRESAKFPMRLEVELFVDGLCGWDSNNSVETDAFIEISLTWGTSNSSMGCTFDGLDGWEPIFGGYRLERKSSKQMRFIAYVDLDKRHDMYQTEEAIKKGSPVFVEGTRLTNMRSGAYRDRVYISAIRTKMYSPDRSTIGSIEEAKNLNLRLAGTNEIPGKLCRMGLKLKINKNTEEALDKFNIVASMTARTWDGIQWSENKVKTSNPAAVALEVLTGLIHELSEYKDDPNPAISEIDLYSFGKLYEFCETQEVNIDGVVIPLHLQSNGVITVATRKIDMLKSILSTCDAGLYVDEFGKIVVYWDAPQGAPIALLNPQRIVKMNEKRNLNRRADGYKVDFIDEVADWKQDTKEILRPRVASDLLNTFTSIKFDLTTSYNQAMWLARRLMAKEILRPGEVVVSVGKEGRLYRPGSLIKVQHEGFKIGLGSGEIIEILREGDYITGFRLMERFDISSDRDYFIEYFVVNENDHHVVEPHEYLEGPDTDNHQTLKLQSVGKYTDTLLLTTPIPADDFYTPEMFNILSVLHSEVKSENGLGYKIYESKRYLVTGLNPTQQGYDLTLVQYDDEIYNTTTIDEIPEYQSSILSKPPGVYDSYSRKPLDGEPGQGMIDPPGLAQIVRPMIARDAPGYRGATYTVYTGNTGVNTSQGSGKTMREGDWVAYLGNTGAWEQGYCYRWNGSSWDKILMTETGPYMAALPDITENGPLGVFSQVLAAHIIALTATIEALQAKVLKLYNPNDSTKYIELNGQQGTIKSAGFSGIDGATPGFQITARDASGNGLIEANNIKTKNMTATDITAVGGTFSGTLVAAGGTFEGTLNANTISLNGNLLSGNGHRIAGDSRLVDSIPAVYPYRTPLIKTLKIIGTGSIMLRIRLAGFFFVRKYDIDGSAGSAITDRTIPAITTNDYPNISLNPSGITYLHLFGDNSPVNSSNPDVYFENTIFEVWCHASTPPGILKYMSG